MKRLTVFTPTYNRAYTLDNLYNSLVRQSSQQFLWLIVDDGSTDDTDFVVSQFIAEGKIDIKYFKQHNMGKHAAHNFGVTLTNTELFVCVDSDDALITDAVEKILAIWDRTPKDKNICGIIGPRSNAKLETWPKHKHYGKSGQLYEKYGFVGDTIMVFRADVIKQYYFPVFAGEKFVTESVIYQKIDVNYRYVFTDKVLYIGEYLQDGLSQKMMKIMLHSPKGTALHYLQSAKYNLRIISRIKAYACFLAISELFGIDNIFLEVKIKAHIVLLGKLFKQRYINLFYQCQQVDCNE